MKHILLALIALALAFLTGCKSSDPLYYDELTEAETQSLVNGARELALETKAMPDHLRMIFAEMTPNYVRVNYDGSKHGKAAIRWEIYEPSGEKRLTQKDVNPYWIMVYAMGDLTDPEWKLSHASLDQFDPKGKDKQEAFLNSRKGVKKGAPGTSAQSPRSKNSNR